jgi:hypothetical protein
MARFRVRIRTIIVVVMAVAAVMFAFRRLQPLFAHGFIASTEIDGSYGLIKIHVWDAIGRSPIVTTLDATATHA